MLVRDYMTTELVTVQETDNLLDATMFFVRSTFRHLPVVRGRQLVGIITERDVKQYAPSVLSGISADDYNSILETTSISRVMARTLITVRPEQSVLEAAKLLYAKRLGCLLVVQDGELVGIITTTNRIARKAPRLQQPHPPIIRLFRPSARWLRTCKPEIFQERSQPSRRFRTTCSKLAASLRLARTAPQALLRQQRRVA